MNYASHGGVAAHTIGQLHQYLPELRPVRIDRPRPIRDWTAQQLGVHPAIHGADAPETDGTFVLPHYLERDHDRRLRDRLSAADRNGQAVLVLVRGRSCTGKTRTAFEAVRVCLTDWHLVFPKNAERLLALLDADALAPRTVLWLNETQNFLAGPDGEQAAAALHSRLETAGPLVIVGTLWPEYHRALTTTPQTGQGQDRHPSTRALLDQAVLVNVPDRFPTDSRTALSVHRDPSLALAADTSTDGMITQTLAAGPELVDYYEQAVEPNGPYGRAVITAAMDARRLGHTSPLPAALLKAAARDYLTHQQRVAAPATWFTHALVYARETVKGVAAALEPVAHPDGMGALPDIYRLNDYLDQHARTARRYAFPPDSFWTAVRDHAASTVDLTKLAEHARQRGRQHIEADLYRQAASAGDTSALFQLVRLREWAGDAEGVERLCRQAADAGVAPALGSLARLRDYAGDAEGAERFARQAAEAGHPDALSEQALRRWDAGDAEAAERLYRQAADAGVTSALFQLARLRWNAGDTEGSERFAWQAAEAGHTFAVQEMARRREQTGNVESAERLYRQAADAGDSFALGGLARLRWNAGDTEGAERFAWQAAEAGDTFALNALAQRREQTGNVESAERFARQAAEAGHPDALRAMALRREWAGDVESAERLARQAADAGDTSTLYVLARGREQLGDAEAAERLYRQAANAGNSFALGALARLREEAGNVEGAERLYRQAADAKDRSALGALARLREEAGDTEGAERFARRAADAGDTSALPMLARLREEAGNAEGAERLYRQAADAGNITVLEDLARLRDEAGDTEGAERLRSFGLEADGSPAMPWN
ncbi:tetratricopeptide repeat protein [Streptomyces mirabilis]|uniref:tetratricopeptide repeat protein n=1 Tax=Streptomyces mirabilis TaxID=68239 RepID=UPI0036EACDE9